MRISDWSSDVCSSDLPPGQRLHSLSSDGYALVSGADWAHGASSFGHTYGSSSVVSPGSHMHGESPLLGRTRGGSEPVMMPSAAWAPLEMPALHLPPQQYPQQQQHQQQQQQHKQHKKQQERKSLG